MLPSVHHERPVGHCSQATATISAEQRGLNHHRDLGDQQQLAFVHDVAQRFGGKGEDEERCVGGDLDQRRYERRKRDSSHHAGRRRAYDEGLRGVSAWAAVQGSLSKKR